MSDPQLTKENQVHFMVMVALEPQTLQAIRDSKLSEAEQQKLISVCHSDSTAADQLEALLAKDWPRLALAVEALFYKNHDKEVFASALKGVVSSRDRQYVQRWTGSIVEAILDRPKWVEPLISHYPELNEPIHRFTATANTINRRRLLNMLAIRKPIVEKILDENTEGEEDPRLAMRQDKPAKISLDGEIIDIEATPEALKQALSLRRKRYSWDGITTETYVRKDGELRRRVIFYDWSR